MPAPPQPDQASLEYRCHFPGDRVGPVDATLFGATANHHGQDAHAHLERLFREELPKAVLQQDQVQTKDDKLNLAAVLLAGPRRRVPAVLRINDGARNKETVFDLFVRLPRSVARNNGLLCADGKKRATIVLKGAPARQLLANLQCYQPRGAQHFHPHISSILLSMLGAGELPWERLADGDGSKWTYETRFTEPDMRAANAVRVVCVPPLDSDLEKCLCMLGHDVVATRSSGGGDGESESGSDCDLPLNRLVDQAVWGGNVAATEEVAGLMQRCSHHPLIQHRELSCGLPRLCACASGFAGRGWPGGGLLARALDLLQAPPPPVAAPPAGGAARKRETTKRPSAAAAAAAAPKKSDLAPSSCDESDGALTPPPAPAAATSSSSGGSSSSSQAAKKKKRPAPPPSDDDEDEDDEDELEEPAETSEEEDEEEDEESDAEPEPEPEPPAPPAKRARAAAGAPAAAEPAAEEDHRSRSLVVRLPALFAAERAQLRVAVVPELERLLAPGARERLGAAAADALQANVAELQAPDAEPETMVAALVQVVANLAAGFRHLAEQRDAEGRVNMPAGEAARLRELAQTAHAVGSATLPGVAAALRQVRDLEESLAALQRRGGEALDGIARGGPLSAAAQGAAPPPPPPPPA